MAFIALPNGIKIEIKMRKNGAPVINVEWGIVNVSITSELLQDVAQAVRGWWNTEMKPLMAASLTLEEIVVTQWDTAEGWQEVYVESPPLAGTATGGDLPSNVAAVTTFLTGMTGRSNRGRVYNCGLTDAQVTGNTIGGAYLVAMLVAWNEFDATLESLSCDHVVASFVTEGAPREVGVATLINNYSMNNVIDTQRRRIPQVDN